jgi:hypothetical protein
MKENERGWFVGIDIDKGLTLTSPRREAEEEEDEGETSGLKWKRSEK